MADTRCAARDRTGLRWAREADDVDPHPAAWGVEMWAGDALPPADHEPAGAPAEEATAAIPELRVETAGRRATTSPSGDRSRNEPGTLPS